MGRRSVSKRPKGKQSEWKEPYEMLNEAKSLSNNNSWAKEGQRKAPEPVKSERSPENHSEQSPTKAKKNNKTTKKKLRRRS